MEARQRVKLSLTNRSIGLISAFAERQIAFNDYVPRSGKPAGNDTAPTAAQHPSDASQSHILRSPHRTRRSQPTARRAVGRPGGHSEGPAPDPIPNSAVKTLRANGTAS